MKELEKIRDELANRSAGNDEYRAAAFSEGWDAAMERVKPLVDFANHPDIKELPCECGFYPTKDDETVHHTCIKCYAKQALLKFKGE